MFGTFFSMLQALRDSEIVRRLRTDGPSSVDALARHVGVSESTMRRDLARLGAQGALSRVRGGAKVDEGEDDDLPFSAVVGHDAEDKLKVAKAAAELVRDDDVLLLDIGTTVAHLARALRGRTVTVITSSLAVLDILRDDATVELIVLGGAVRPSYHSMVGLLTETALTQVRADLAFLGASGVRANGDVLDSTRVEVPVKRSMLRAADRSVLLADRHKFPGRGVLKVCDVADLDVIVTNQGMEEPLMQLCRSVHVEVIAR